MKKIQYVIIFLFGMFCFPYYGFSENGENNIEDNVNINSVKEEESGKEEENAISYSQDNSSFVLSPFKYYDKDREKRKEELFWSSGFNKKLLDPEDMSLIFSTDTYSDSETFSLSSDMSSNTSDSPKADNVKKEETPTSENHSEIEKEKKAVSQSDNTEQKNKTEIPLDDIETISKKTGLSQNTINEICAMPTANSEVTEKLKDAVFVCPARPYDYTKTKSIYTSTLLSKEEKEKMIDTDQKEKFKKFFQKRENVCIPTYNNSVLWEKNRRYRKTDSGCGIVLYRSAIRKGDTIEKILSEWIDEKEAEALIKSAAPVYSFKKLTLGNIFTIECGESNSLQSFSYDIDEENRLIIEREKKGFSSKIYKQDIEIKLNLVKGTITSSLFEAIAESGENAVLGARLRDIFRHQLNFIDDVENMEFCFLVEKKYINGIFKRYGEIIGAIVSSGEKKYEAYLYGKKRKEYYNEKGEVLSSEFLTTPVTNAKITSQYSGARVHPYKKVARPHLGVDYNAPMGAPVKAIGNGVVTALGWQNGYGNTIIISHGNNLETQYAHLSRFQEGLKENDIVSKGQIIGFVGRTGITTAPHVDFRTIKQGKFINPKEITTAVQQTIPKKEQKAFQKTVENIRSFLNGRDLSEYKK